MTQKHTRFQNFRPQVSTLFDFPADFSKIGNFFVLNIAAVYIKIIKKVPVLRRKKAPPCRRQSGADAI